MLSELSSHEILTKAVESNAKSIRSNAVTIRWFIGAFLVIVVGELMIVWNSYVKSAGVDLQLQIYIAAQRERLTNIERAIDRNERVLIRVEDILRPARPTLN